MESAHGRRNIQKHLTNEKKGAIIHLQSKDKLLQIHHNTVSSRSQEKLLWISKIKGGLYISKKEFDRSRAFTFYREWLETAQAIEEEYGKEPTAEYFLALANYALYEIEPQRKQGPLKYLWPQTKEKIDASQEHRARGFSKEDTELTDRIRKYKEEHPDESQDKIAQAIGCSKGKVNSALRTTESLRNNTDTSTNTNTSTGTTVTVTDEVYDLLGNIDSDAVLEVTHPVSEEFDAANMFDNGFVYKIEDMPTLLDDYDIGVYGEDPADVYDYFVDNIMINYDEGFSADEIAADFEWPVGFVQAVVNYYGL